MKRLLTLAWGFALGIVAAGQAPADPITGDIFYTTFSPNSCPAPNLSCNVWRVTTSFNGTTFTLGTPVPIGSTVGADGIVGNPKNSDLLIVGGQGPNVNTISKTTGVDTSFASPVSAFHLAVPTVDTVLASGIPGGLARHPILPTGALGAGTVISLSGDDAVLTTIIPTPSSGFFYTSSGPGGVGSYGTIVFITGVDTATAAVTDRLHGAGGTIGTADLPAAHGGVYDPFTNTVIIMGDGRVTQLNLAGAILSEFSAPGFNFDQGGVDGKGHLFAASNTGHLLFLDYAASGLVGAVGNFSALPFLMDFLDDVAPLVGPGGTTPPGEVPEPATFALLGLGLAGLAASRRRKR